MSDWTDQVADTIETAVTTVRDKTVVPVRRIVRAVVGGLVAGSLAAVAGVMLALFAFRALVVLFTEFLPGDVWTAHLVVGGIFTAAGLFLLSRS